MRIPNVTVDNSLRCIEELDALGIAASYRADQQCIECVIQTVKERNYVNNVVKQLYLKVVPKPLSADSI